MIDGYYGVILPARQWWQGFFLDDTMQPMAEAYLKQMGRDERVRASFGTLPALIGPGAPTPAFEGYPAALASAVARTAGSEDVRQIAALNVLARAFAGIMGLRYFTIISETVADAGERTQLENWPNARSTDDGRRMLSTHPLVLRYQAASYVREFARVHPTVGNA